MMRQQLLTERRHDLHAGIVCENGILRLRVVRKETSLALQIDARTAKNRWELMAVPAEGAGIQLVDEDGRREVAELQTYDPVMVNGRSIGVALHGHLGEAALTVIALLDRPQAWCQHFVEVKGLPSGFYRRLTQTWQVAPGHGPAALCWPSTPMCGTKLSHVSAALVQTGHYFAALAPDVNEDDRTKLGLRIAPGAPAEIEYGFQCEDSGTLELPSITRIAYSLCLDARAIPERGFQEVVRWMGSYQGPVPSPAIDAIPPGVDDLPAFYSQVVAAEWRPCMREGSPAEIASHVHQMLSAVESGEWARLEEGLCWLDRLCLQQRISSLQGESAPGTVPHEPEWQSVAVWLPGLLLRAFRLTGIGEYAARAFAAFSALSAADQSRVLGHLRPRFGDIYVHVEYREAVALCGLPIAVSLIGDDGIELRAQGNRPMRPLRLVVEGDRESYSLGINGAPLGRFPTSQLRGGFDIAK